MAGTLAAAALAAGCATPVFRDVPVINPTPAEVAGEPESYHGVDVVWGGKIIEVRNLADATEVEVVAYPIDDAQRPDQNARTEGRFVIALPGFIEPLDFPTGRFVTLRGHVDGTRAARIDERDVAFPIVAHADVHLWPVNFPYDAPRVRFSLGFGVGIH